MDRQVQSNLWIVENGILLISREEDITTEKESKGYCLPGVEDRKTRRLHKTGGNGASFITITDVKIDSQPKFLEGNIVLKQLPFSSVIVVLCLQIIGLYDNFYFMPPHIYKICYTVGENESWNKICF